MNVFVVAENVIHASDDFRYGCGMMILLGLPRRMLWIWIDLYRPLHNPSSYNLHMMAKISTDKGRRDNGGEVSSF